MKKQVYSLLAIVALTFVATLSFSHTKVVFAGNARNLTPIERFKNEQTNAFVNVSLDRADLSYHEGEKVTVTIKSSVPGYLYLFNVSSKGEITLLLPNKCFKDNKIEANKDVVYPTINMDFDFVVGGPDYGEETMKALVVDRELELSDEAFKANAMQMTDGDMDKIVAMLEEKKAAEDRERSLIREKNTFVNPSNHVTAGEIRYQTSQSGSRGVSKRKFVLCLGVGDYQDPEINDLPACVNDANEVAKMFENECGVDKDYILVGVNDKASKENIHAVFSKLSEELKPGDVLYVFWTGHGHTDSLDSYICPYDSKIRDKHIVVESLISSNELQHWLEGLSGVMIFLFIDACHSGGMVESPKSVSNDSKGDADARTSEPFSDFLNGGSSVKSADRTGRNVKMSGKEETSERLYTFGLRASHAKAVYQENSYVLCSSTKDQISFVSLDGNLSVFTKAFVQTMKRAPSGFTHMELKGEIKSLVQNFVDSDYSSPNARATQTVVEQNLIPEPVVIKP